MNTFRPGTCPLSTSSTGWKVAVWHEVGLKAASSLGAERRSGDPESGGRVVDVRAEGVSGMKPVDDVLYRYLTRLLLRCLANVHARSPSFVAG